MSQLGYDFALIDWMNRHWAIIFSHEFAKAFWGYETITNGLDSSKVAWKHYQHKMLDEIQEGKDPIKYLEKFL